MDPLTVALQAVYEATQDAPGTAAVVILDHPDHGRGGFVYIPEGHDPAMTVIGTLGAQVLKGRSGKEREMFDAMAMFLFDPTPAQS
jgi:hypothetical protein